MTTLDTAAHVSTAATRWVDDLAALTDGAGRAFASLGRGAGARLAAWNDARVTRRQLGRLSARQLDDIGLCRADIEAVAARLSR